MLEKRYRRWGSMKHAKTIKIQIADTTLAYLEHWSTREPGMQVGYGQAVDDLCRQFQNLYRQEQLLRQNYDQLLVKYQNLSGHRKNFTANEHLITYQRELGAKRGSS